MLGGSEAGDHTRMESGLQDRNTVVFQHVEEGRFACIVKAEEQQLYRMTVSEKEWGGNGELRRTRMLVHQAQGREDVPDCESTLSIGFVYAL